MKEKRRASGKKYAAVIVAVLCLLAVLAAVLTRLPESAGSTAAPTLTVETPERVSPDGSGELSLDVTVSSLGDAEYPAASMSICFDTSRLEFLGVEEGNVFVRDTPNAAGVGQKLPEWSFDAAQSNKTGRINIMYLDFTGGEHAFAQELLAEDDNVLLRLRFRLRGSARRGDVYELTVEDAVFAASDETMSLAAARGTLKTENGRIVVGE